MYGNYAGSRVAPGRYKARIKFNGEEKTVSFSVLPNPNLSTTEADFQRQQALLKEIEKGINNIHQSVSDMRKVQKQLGHYLEILADNNRFTSLIKKAKEIDEKLKNWEQNLIQPNQKTFQDVINFNNKLNAEWMYLKDFVDSEIPEVTQGAMDRHKDLKLQWNKQKAALDQIIEEDFKAFGDLFNAADVPALIIP